MTSSSRLKASRRQSGFAQTTSLHGSLATTSGGHTALSNGAACGQPTLLALISIWSIAIRHALMRGFRRCVVPLSSHHPFDRSSLTAWGTPGFWPPTRSAEYERSRNRLLLAASTRGLSRSGHPPPGVIRVKSRHGRSDRVRARAKVFLVHVPMMTDKECHQAGNAILRRIGHEGEPAGHLAVHHVLAFAARRIRPLPVKNPIIITMIGVALIGDGISLLRRSCGRRSEWARVLAGSRRPIEAIFFSLLAE